MVELDRATSEKCNTVQFETHLKVRQAELDLPIQTSGPHQGRVQRVRPVGGHQHFDVASRVETIQLIDELQHGPLDLVVSTGAVIKTSTWQVQRVTRSEWISLHAGLKGLLHVSGCFSFLSNETNLQ